MASQSLISTSFLFVVALILCFLICVSCNEFEVGERAGWIVPLPNNTNFYNNWASQKRFKVGDTIRFKYKKDSVMEVNKTNYNECNSIRPNYFSNNGQTLYTLDRSGFFYFMSGMTGHCEMGQRMIVWVIGQDENSTAGSSGSSHGSVVSYGVVFVMATISFVYMQYFFG